MKKGSLIDRNENIWNVPNLLTMLRMAAVVVFIVLFARGKKNAAMIVFILAAVTDVLDGYIACLTVTGYVPLWLVIIEGAKECFMVVGGCFVLRKKKLVVQADYIGKAATVTFIAAILATFLHDYTAPWDFALQCGAVTLALAAMIFYIIDTVRKVRADEQQEKE